MTAQDFRLGQNFRLDRGGIIDRDRPVSFTFDGTRYSGFSGDTLASALLANGIHMVARSFKYHRPRGIVGAGSEDPAGIVQIGSDAARTLPNTRATEQEIYDGLEAFPQNCWPTLKHDLNAVNDFFSAFLPAGFYYKTFMGPLGSWSFYERFIRSASGLGKHPTLPDPDRYEHCHRHCEVLVIGAGPAGLMAARTAAASGARVMLVEETAQLGGRLLSRSVGDKSGEQWLAECETQLREHPNVDVLARTCAFGYYGENYIGLIENLTDHRSPADLNADARAGVHTGLRQRVWHIRAREVVLATGAIERPLVFHENDRPGIMLASACRTYLHRYGVLPGRNALVFTNNDSAWATAFEMADAGADIAGIVDAREAPDPRLIQAAVEKGITVHTRSVITGTRGRHRVSAATIQKLDANGEVTREPSREACTLACDLVAVSGGWSPNVALFSQSRGKLRYDEELVAFRPGQSWQRERSAGACNGEFALDDCLREGAAAGAEAATRAGFNADKLEVPDLEKGRGDRVSFGQMALWEVPGARPAHKTRAFVDLQTDATAKDLHLAQAEGYLSVEHAKRYTTTGMGTDQGKTSSVNAFGILSQGQGKTIAELGVTTFRQPYKPVTIGALAGQHTGIHLAPRRTTPMHECHLKAGALFEPVGDWLRAWIYPRSGENFNDTLMRECRAARESLGVLDASTLGKIDVRGKDARQFLTRVYTNAWMKLKPGHCRYGLMLGEDGMVMDDGVTACIDDSHFHMTTTTGGAATVLTWLEDYLQTEWPDLEVYLTSTTEQWAVLSLCGPNSAKLVADLVDGLDPDPDRFKFMTWQDGIIDGVPVRVFRISFTGELSYEINIAAGYGAWAWDKVMAAGRQYNITAYGTEAMHLLRAEKGFIIVGQDTDGTMTPLDLRMNWIVKKNGDFIGRRSLDCAAIAKPGRRQLVGLLTNDREIVLAEGAHVIRSAVEGATPVPMLGHVTSSYYSPNLERSIALAAVKSGGDRMGERLYVAREGDDPIAVTVTEVDFLSLASGDQDGEGKA